MLQTVRVSFSKPYYPGRQRSYTYETEDELGIGQIVYVEANDEIKKAMVVGIDPKYNQDLADKLGGLKKAYAKNPEADK